MTLTPGGDIRHTLTPGLLSYVRYQTLASKRKWRKARFAEGMTREGAGRYGVPGKRLAFAGVISSPAVLETVLDRNTRCIDMRGRTRRQGILLRCAVYHNRAVTLITAPGVITIYDENGIREAASRTKRVAP